MIPDIAYRAVPLVPRDNPVTNAALVERMAREAHWPDTLLSGTPTLLDLANATGTAVCVAGGVRTLGTTPPLAAIEEIVEWLGTRDEPLHATSALSTHFPPARAYAAEASGLAAARASASCADYVQWFRAAHKQTVKRAGDPRKPVTIDGDGVARLHPRGSFELWEQEVKGTAMPWRNNELDAIGALCDTIIGVLLPPMQSPS